MKRKVKAFTLIELIVVIAIIAILAALIVPNMMGYIRTSRASRFNANAKTVYSGAQLAITDSNAGNFSVIKPNCVYTGSDDAIAHPNGGGDDCDLTNYLGETFDGYFAFMTDTQGYGCIYAVWSDKPIPVSAVQQFTEKEVKNSLGTTLPMGCHPLLLDDSNS